MPVSVIDLHSHILPGLDDGARDRETSLQMAEVAVADGVRTIAATPHVSFDYEFDFAEVRAGVAELNELFERSRIALTVVKGAEIALSRLVEIPDEQLPALTLSNGSALLVESPYTRTADLLERVLFDLRVKGFRPLLAHPERSPVFQDDIERLQRLVAGGVLCSVGAGSLTGSFGSTVRRFASRLLELNLVHAISSDAHDAGRRPPILTMARESADDDLPELASQFDWLTRAAPDAILRGTSLPPRPELMRPHRRWSLGRRLLGRRA